MPMVKGTLVIQKYQSPTSSPFRPIHGHFGRIVHEVCRGRADGGKGEADQIVATAAVAAFTSEPATIAMEGASQVHSVCVVGENCAGNCDSGTGAARTGWRAPGPAIAGGVGHDGIGQRQD